MDKLICELLQCLEEKRDHLFWICLVSMCISALPFGGAIARMPVYIPRCVFPNHDLTLSNDDLLIIRQVAERWRHPTFYCVRNGAGHQVSDCRNQSPYTIKGVVKREPEGFIITGLAHERGNDPEDDRRLSLRRALAVQQVLISDGVPEQDITVIGRGAFGARYFFEPYAVYEQGVLIEDYDMLK